MPTALWYCPLCQAEGADTDRVFCANDGARVRPIAERGGEWLGKVLAGKYRILRFLDAGGMAEVYEAERLGNGRRVAVKLLHAALSADRAMLERFLHEARLVSLIAHPNVAAIEDFGTLPDAVQYMVLELLEGRSLAAELASGRVPVLSALHYAMQACEGLAAAHERAIVHCDIKPENLFLQRVSGEPAPVVKILDLGIGRLFATSGAGASTQSNVIAGTPAYMSPEQVLGAPLAPATDIYSLGVVVYQMLFGALPFEGASIGEVLRKHVRELPAWPAERAAALGVPAAAEAVVLRALAKEPLARQSSMMDLQRELASVLRAAKTSNRPEGPRSRPSASMRQAPTVPQIAPVLRLVPLATATGADAEVVELASGVYWVGRRHHRFLECNAYLRVFRQGDARVSVLVDPGPPKDLEVVRAKVAAVIGGLGRLDYVFLNHQDPDVASNAAAIQQSSPRAQIVCSEDTFRLAQFYGLDGKRFTAVESFPEGRMKLATGHELVFVPTPFCHFRGAVMLYDPASRVLFTGDLFGGAQASDLVATPAAWPGVEMFHQIYMPSRRALALAVARIRALEPSPLLLAPQHGALVGGDDVATTMRRIEELEVGLDLLGAEGDAPFLAAANEIVHEYAELMGEERARELLERCSADGTFTSLFVRGSRDTIASFKIAPLLGIKRLAADALANLLPELRGDLQRTIRSVVRRYDLPGWSIPPSSMRLPPGPTADGG